MKKRFYIVLLNESIDASFHANGTQKDLDALTEACLKAGVTIRYVVTDREADDDPLSSATFMVGVCLGLAHTIPAKVKKA